MVELTVPTLLMTLANMNMGSSIPSELYLLLQSPISTHICFGKHFPRNFRHFYGQTKQLVDNFINTQLPEPNSLFSVYFVSSSSGFNPFHSCSIPFFKSSILICCARISYGIRNCSFMFSENDLRVVLPSPDLLFRFKGKSLNHFIDWDQGLTFLLYLMIKIIISMGGLEFPPNLLISQVAIGLATNLLRTRPSSF